MPRGDRTGPMGMGPLTGRGAGFCASAGAPLARGFGAGRGAPGCAPGYGRGGRGGRGRGFGAGAFPGGFNSPVDEKQLLVEQAQVLETQLAQIRQRQTELESAE